jgi:hypothetical protein
MKRMYDNFGKLGNYAVDLLPVTTIVEARVP